MYSEEIPVKKSKFKDSQIVGMIKRAEAGEPVASQCREAGISSATFYKWRSKYGGMDVSMLARVKELEEENRRPQVSAHHEEGPASHRSLQHPGCRGVDRRDPSRLG